MYLHCEKSEWLIPGVAKKGKQAIENENRCSFLNDTGEKGNIILLCKKVDRIFFQGIELGNN